MSRASAHAAAYAVWYAEKEQQTNWAEWVRRQPKAPMYWENEDDEENFIGVGDDGDLVFMPVRDAGGEGVDLKDMPRFMAWVREVYDL